MAQVVAEPRRVREEMPVQRAALVSRLYHPSADGQTNLSVMGPLTGSKIGLPLDFGAVVCVSSTALAPSLSSSNPVRTSSPLSSGRTSRKSSSSATRPASTTCITATDVVNFVWLAIHAMVSGVKGGESALSIFRLPKALL